MDEEMFDSVYGSEMLLLGVQIPLEGAIWLPFVSCCICISVNSPSNQTIQSTSTVTSPAPYLPAATADIIHDPISNKTPTLTFCFVFNKSAQQHPHILWPSEREFIIQLLTKSGTPQAVPTTAGEVTHILLIYWHDILDIAK